MTSLRLALIQAPRSLSVRLTLYSLLFTLAVTTSLWTFLYFSLRRELTAQDQGLIRDKIQTIRSLLPPVGANRELLRRRIEQEWFKRTYEHVYVRVIDASGTLITETPSLTPANEEIHEILMKRGPQSNRDGELEKVETPSGGIFQITAMSMQPTPDSRYFVEIALERTNEQSLIHRFHQVIWMVLMIAAVGSLWMANTIGRMALQPIRSFLDHTKRITSDHMNERIALEKLPIEFRELAATFNGMLDRLQNGFDRLSRFSEDMAHEIRTPVNNLLGSMSVMATKERSKEAYHSMIGSGIEECERLKRIIDSLLFMARANDPKMAVQKQDLNLEEELREIVGFYEASAEEAGIQMNLSVPKHLRLPADRTLLQRCLGNLISNSIRHSAAGSKITLQAEQLHDKVRIEVGDQGAGIPPQAIKNIGERFFRPEPSRSKVSGGIGLGLSIVKTIVKVHGGSMEVKSQVNQGTSVALTFPI